MYGDVREKVEFTLSCMALPLLSSLFLLFSLVWEGKRERERCDASVYERLDELWLGWDYGRFGRHISRLTLRAFVDNRATTVRYQNTNLPEKYEIAVNLSVGVCLLAFFFHR